MNSCAPSPGPGAVYIFMNLTALGTSHKWNRRALVFLALADFTRGVAGVGTSFLFINDLESIVWMDPTLFIPSSIDDDA